MSRGFNNTITRNSFKEIHHSRKNKMVKLNPSEIQLLTEALFEAESPAKLEDVKSALDEEKVEVEEELNELEETPESQVQFPIRRRRAVVYRRLFCIGLGLVFLCAALILATYLLKSKNYSIEISLPKGHTLNYHLAQEMVLKGSKAKPQSTKFSEVITVEVLNKTKNGHWLKFHIPSLPTFERRNFTFLIRVDLGGEKTSLEVDSSQERFEIYGNSERNPELDFYLHNLFNQLLPAVKINLLDVILSQISTRTHHLAVDNSWYLPGRVNIQQRIKTDKEQVQVISTSDPQDFLDFGRDDTALPNIKLEFHETASISKETGMLLKSELRISASLPLEGTFDDGAVVGVEFTSSINLAGETNEYSEITSGNGGQEFVKIPKPSDPSYKPEMVFIRPEYKHVHVNKNTDLVTEVKELLNLTTNAEPKEQTQRLLSPLFTASRPSDGIGFAVKELSAPVLGKTKEGKRQGQEEKSSEQDREQKMEEREGRSEKEDETSYENGDWKVHQDGPTYDDEGNDDTMDGRLDDYGYNDDSKEEEAENVKEKDQQSKQSHTDNNTSAGSSTAGATKPSSSTSKPTVVSVMTTAAPDDDWNPFSFIENFWKNFMPRFGEEEQENKAPSTTQPPTTTTTETPTTKKATTIPSTSKTTIKTTAKANDEENNWNPFKMFDNIFRSFGDDDGDEKEDDDESLFPFKFPSIPLFHFPDFTQRKRRSLDPEEIPAAKPRSSVKVSQVRPENRSLRRDRRRLTDDGLERDETTATELDPQDVNKIWDVVSDKSFSIKKRPRKTTRVFKETVHGIEVQSHLEHEIEALREVVGTREKNTWAIRLRLMLEAGGHYIEVFERVIDINEIERVFLTQEKPKKEYGVEQGGTLVMCRPLVYVQKFCVAMKFSYNLHLVHAVTRLNKEYPVRLTIHFKQLAAINTVVSSHASSLLNSGGVYGQGALFQAKVPLDLEFSEANKPEWCTSAKLRSRIGSFYRKWSAVNQWQCPLDEAVSMGTTCIELDEHAQLGKEEEPLTEDSAYANTVHFLDTC